MSATARPPRGLLPEQARAAVARLHAAGDGGLVLYFGTAWRSVAWWESAPKWSTVVRLRNRTVLYVEDFRVDGESCIRLTSAGRAHYAANLDRYRAACPEVEIPRPGLPRSAPPRGPRAAPRRREAPPPSSSRSPTPRSRPATPATTPRQPAPRRGRYPPAAFRVRALARDQRYGRRRELQAELVRRALAPAGARSIGGCCACAALTFQALPLLMA